MEITLYGGPINVELNYYSAFTVATGIANDLSVAYLFKEPGFSDNIDLLTFLIAEIKEGADEVEAINLIRDTKSTISNSLNDNFMKAAEESDLIVIDESYELTDEELIELIDKDKNIIIFTFAATQGALQHSNLAEFAHELQFMMLTDSEDVIVEELI